MKAPRSLSEDKFSVLDWIRNGFQFPPIPPPRKPKPLPPIVVPPKPANPPRKPGESK